MQLVDKTVAARINGGYKRTMDRPKSRLARAREKKGLQQEDVAAEFKVTQATVSYWENGEHTPHPSKWGKIAEFYGLPLKRVIAMFTSDEAA